MSSSCPEYLQIPEWGKKVVFLLNNLCMFLFQAFHEPLVACYCSLMIHEEAVMLGLDVPLPP